MNDARTENRKKRSLNTYYPIFTAFHDNLKCAFLLMSREPSYFRKNKLEAEFRPSGSYCLPCAGNLKFLNSFYSSVKGDAKVFSAYPIGHYEHQHENTTQVYLY